MDDDFGPYWELALRVIMQAMYDLTHGSKQKRDDARLQILDGGLDHWIEIVSLNEGIRNRIKAVLLELMGGYEACLEFIMKREATYEQELHQSAGRH
jgi:hypothetical protein